MTGVALLATDYVGLKPKILLEPGQLVGLGTPLMLDKRDPNVLFTSPGSGRLVGINRGRRRALQSVVIELDDTAAPAVVFEPNLSQTPDTIRNLLLRSGAWTSFRTRPYNRVADSSSSPRSIFVTAIDTRPLAADPSVVIAQRENEFQRGMEIISQLGDWPVYLCTGPNWSGPEVDGDRIRRAEFDGPHPAGLPGTHIHHLDPVSADRMVWHIGYQDVIAIGHLFQTGRLLAERIVSIAGPSVLKPRLVRTRLGASVEELMSGELALHQACRVISGSVLDGAVAHGPSAYLGRYHNQISALPDKSERHLFGWMSSGRQRRSKAVPFASARGDDSGREFTTACHGRQAAMLPAGAFERVMPLDILPIPLLRAILVRDTDTAQDLGCLELAEEDLALSSFVCPGKQDYGAALRINLEQIEEDG